MQISETFFVPIQKLAQQIFPLLLFFIPASISAQIQFENVINGSGVEYTGESYGASWGDLTEDGWPDLFVNHHRNRSGLYINQGNGTFDDRSHEVDIWSTDPFSDQHGGAWSDFDNDGDQELFVSLGPTDNSQFLVNQGGILTDQTQLYGFDDIKWSGRLPVWFDFNTDGLLDFALAIHLSKPALFEQASGEFTRINFITQQDCYNNHYLQFADLTNDGNLDWICAGNPFPNKIYELTAIPYLDVTSILPPTGIVNDSTTADFDRNLEPDMFVLAGKNRISGAEIVSSNSIEAHIIASSADEKGVSFESDGDVSFVVHWNNRSKWRVYIGSTGTNTPVTSVDGVLYFTLSSNDSTVWGMPAHDPLTDNGIYVGYEPGTQTWQFLVSPGGRWNYTYSFINSTSEVSNLTVPGLQGVDKAKAPKLLMNNSGNFLDQTKSAGLNTALSCVSTVAADFDNDMDEDLYLVCRGAVSNLANRLYENQGDGTFTRVNAAGGAEGPVGPGAGLSESVVVADYDIDGFIDLFVTNGLKLYPEGTYSTGGPDQLFHNLGNANHWIELDLVGTVSNRDGIGAKVYATAGGVTQLREQNGGYHRWSQNHQRIHFGLASNQLVDLEVHWPNGMVDTFNNVDADRLYRVNEGGSIEEIPIGSVSSRLQISDVTVAEDAGQASFTVSLSGGSTQTITVDYATADGTATANSDYTAVNGGLTFLPGQTAKTVTIPILDDALPEGTEAFTVTLSNASGASIINATGTGTITDNETSPCGQPPYDKATESAVFIWKDCSDDSWHVRVTAGGQSLNYVGTVDADQPFSSVSPFQLAGADVLDYTTDPTQIAYSFFVGNAGQDGADFTFPAGANVCFGVDAPAGIPVFLGAARTPMSVPFELNSLGPCTAPPPPSASCGEPSYDRATESAVFVWKNCSDDSWHVRVTAGGQSLNYVGTIDADQPFSSVNPFRLAGADILDYTTDPTQIAYSFFVGNAGQDGADFTFPAGANVCFGVDAPAGIPVLLGATRTPMTVPFELNSLGPC